MRTSLSLQRSLFNAQRQQIRRTVAGASAAFRSYEARYQRATRGFRRVISGGELARQVGAADVVYVGDYHTLRQAQQGYLEVVQLALATGRRVVLALELLEGRHQATLDAFLAGRLGERTLRERTGHAARGAFDLWSNFAPILSLARRRGLEVVAIDRRARHRSLVERDRYAAARIAAAAAADDRPLVLVLVGQYHVAPMHLPRRVRGALDVERRHLIVYQNAEGIYWRLAAKGLAARASAVEVAEGAVCLVSASPVVCQRSFLDYVEAESGDAPVDEAGLTRTFGQVARAVGRLAGVDVRRALGEVELATATQLQVIERLSRRARFSREELEQLRHHVLSRESAYIPRARVAWLASLSLNHVAEEAAHFVRHVAVGEALEAPRPRAQAFWSRCLEEALGFFGSKLVNPSRQCVGLDEWVEQFRAGRGEKRRLAAFVLALSATAADDDEARALLPLDELPLFNGVSHALGYLLGEAMFLAFEKGQLSRAELRGLFADPFPEPRASWRALCERVGLGPPRRRRRKHAGHARLAA